MHGLLERIRDTEDYQLNEAHPWIIGVYPGDLHSRPLIFIFGNIIRSGQEEWVEVGTPTTRSWSSARLHGELLPERP